jgi:hypothetical protein
VDAGGQTLVLLIVGHVAVVLVARLLIAVPGWIRRPVDRRRDPSASLGPPRSADQAKSDPIAAANDCDSIHSAAPTASVSQYAHQAFTIAR